MIIEAEKSQDLQSVSRRPRRASGVTSSLKASNLKTQEEMLSWFKSEEKKRPMSQLEGSQGKETLSYSDFLSYSGLQLTG